MVKKNVGVGLLIFITSLHRDALAYFVLIHKKAVLATENLFPLTYFSNVATEISLNLKKKKKLRLFGSKLLIENKNKMNLMW